MTALQWGELPMFPLGSVLFPTGLLPLHVFERRYRALTRHCLDSDSEFGVVLIARGSEVGGGDVRHRVGTAARIVDAQEQDDGRFVVVAVGTQRIVVDRWLPEDPYPRAFVAELADDDDLGDELASALDRDRRATERTFRRALALLAELGEASAPATIELSDEPVEASFQMAALAPLGPLDAQRVLEAPGAGQRLRVLGDLLAEQVVVFAHRMAGR